MYSSYLCGMNIDELKEKALGGDGRASLRLGQLYMDGEGVGQSYEEAARWYARAAEQGEGGGKASLAALYEMGWGVKADKQRAFELYTQAGDAASMRSAVGLIMERAVALPPVELYRWLDVASEQGMVEATSLLERMPTEVLAAADAAGYTSASLLLANRYMRGLGVGRDFRRAIALYEKAADYAAAQYNLGLIYEQGIGRRHDYAAAREWYTRAAAQGHTEAKKRLERLPQLEQLEHRKGCLAALFE